ncbi:MAG: hypothetical protein ACFFBD_02100 [Candidatus Hodarchaeota archaeon]
MVFHALSIHFHLGAWMVTVFTSFLAILLTLSNRIGFTDVLSNLASKIFKDKLGFINSDAFDRIVDHLDTGATVSAFVGLLGLIVSGIFGLTDASGLPTLESLTLDAFISGLNTSLASIPLTYKVVWSIVGLLCYLFIGLLRAYFTVYRNERFFDQHISFLFVFFGLQLYGYFLMIFVAASGGQLVYGSTVLEQVPYLWKFLPVENGWMNFSLIAVVLILSAFVLFALILPNFLSKKQETSQITT